MSGMSIASGKSHPS